MFGLANPLPPLCVRCSEIAGDCDPLGALCDGCHETEQAKIAAYKLDCFRLSALEWLRDGERVERLRPAYLPLRYSCRPSDWLSVTRVP